MKTSIKHFVWAGLIAFKAMISAFGAEPKSSPGRVSSVDAQIAIDAAVTARNAELVILHLQNTDIAVRLYAIERAREFSPADQKRVAIAFMELDSGWIKNNKIGESIIGQQRLEQIAKAWIGGLIGADLSEDTFFDADVRAKVRERLLNGPATAAPKPGDSTEPRTSHGVNGKKSLRPSDHTPKAPAVAGRSDGSAADRQFPWSVAVAVALLVAVAAFACWKVLWN